MTDDADPSLGCQGCLCLPACLGLSHQEGNREQTPHIRDNWQWGSYMDTAIISFLLSNCKICDCHRGDHLLLYCDLRKPLNLFLLSFGHPCKIEAIKTCEKWKGVEDRHVRLVWASSEPALQIVWKRGRAGLSLEWRALFPWDLHEVLHQTCSFHVVSRQSSCVCRTGMNANSSGRATTLPCIWSIYSISLDIYKCMKMARRSKSIYSLWAWKIKIIPGKEGVAAFREL